MERRAAPGPRPWRPAASTPPTVSTRSCAPRTRRGRPRDGVRPAAVARCPSPRPRRSPLIAGGAWAATHRSTTSWCRRPRRAAARVRRPRPVSRPARPPSPQHPHERHPPTAPPAGLSAASLPVYFVGPIGGQQAAPTSCSASSSRRTAPGCLAGREGQGRAGPRHQRPAQQQHRRLPAAMVGPDDRRRHGDGPDDHGRPGERWRIRLERRDPAARGAGARLDGPGSGRQGHHPGAVRRGRRVRRAVRAVPHLADLQPAGHGPAVPGPRTGVGHDARAAARCCPRRSRSTFRARRSCSRAR